MPAGGEPFPNKIVGLPNDTLLIVDDRSSQEAYVVITAVDEIYWQASANTEYVDACIAAFTNVIHVDGTWDDDGVTFVVEGKECFVSYEGTITPEPQALV